jgi:Carboxypeptidase regulatory-like domain/TonB-dependent Receptor Plug Domain
MRSLFQLFVASALAVSLYAQAPESAKGTVTGTVFDAVNGRPIPLITVAVNGMSDGKTVTDTDGRYTIILAPGKYKLTFTGENHMEAAVEDIEVKGGETADASTVMQQKGAVTTVDVVEKIGAIESNAESILTERKLSVNTQDSISKDDIKNSTASDAAGALEKVTGISVVDNGYVFVRGLGERYSATMLNNAIIPTTEPERRVVPLDLFPASLIDNIKVLKSYSPDLPGEFSGGLVQMNTVEFPTQKVLQVSVNYGFNSQTTFNRFSQFKGTTGDFFGFGGGSRELPPSSSNSAGPSRWTMSRRSSPACARSRLTPSLAETRLAS